MFGLMTIKECDKKLSDIQKKLDLEKARSTYWKLKYTQPNIEPIILGKLDDIKYIKQ